MSGTVSSIIDYTPQPDHGEEQRRRRLLWLAAAISLSMAALGYFIIITKFL